MGERWGLGDIRGHGQGGWGTTWGHRTRDDCVVSTPPAPPCSFRPFVAESDEEEEEGGGSLLQRRHRTAEEKVRRGGGARWGHFGDTGGDAVPPQAREEEDYIRWLKGQGDIPEEERLQDLVRAALCACPHVPVSPRP